MLQLILIIILLIILLIILNFKKIRINFAKKFKFKYYPTIFVPEILPILLNQDIIKKELQQALALSVNDIYRKNNEWSNSKTGEEFYNKVSKISGWTYAWNPDNNKNKDWLNFGLIYNNKVLEKNSKTCPKTSEILKNIKGINIAGFSLMTPNSKILPHKDSTGINSNSLAIHLGLIIPEKNKCNLVVDNEIIYQEENKIIIFDSNFTHYAENNSNKNRVILYIDKSII